MSEIYTLRRNVTVSNSVVDKLFTVVLENFPTIPEYALPYPGPYSASDNLTITNNNLFRTFIQNSMAGIFIIPVTQVNNEALGQEINVPLTIQSETLAGDTEHENANLNIQIDTVGNSITEWRVILSSANFRGTFPTQTVISVEQNGVAAGGSGADLINNNRGGFSVETVCVSPPPCKSPCATCTLPQGKCLETECTDYFKIQNLDGSWDVLNEEVAGLTIKPGQRCVCKLRENLLP